MVDLAQMYEAQGFEIHARELPAHDADRGAGVVVGGIAIVGERAVRRVELLVDLGGEQADAAQLHEVTARLRVVGLEVALHRPGQVARPHGREDHLHHPALLLLDDAGQHRERPAREALFSRALTKPNSRHWRASRTDE